MATGEPRQAGAAGRRRVVVFLADWALVNPELSEQR